MVKTGIHRKVPPALRSQPSLFSVAPLGRTFRTVIIF
jgi:hypothetical protein